MKELEEETGNIFAVYLEFSHPLVNLQMKQEIDLLLVVTCFRLLHSIEIVFRSGMKWFSFPLNSSQTELSQICCLWVETKKPALN